VIQNPSSAYNAETVMRMSMFRLEKTPDDESEVAKSQAAYGRRTDEWSECLVLIARDEDRAAFTRLFRNFAPLMKAFALSGSPLSANNADELVQDVMVKVWQKAGAYNPEKAAASTWIYTIARNCRTDMYRRLQKFDTALIAEDLYCEQASEDAFALLHQKRRRDEIRGLLKELPADQAQILAKVYMEGKSHSEAAGELELPLGTVKSRVRLAVQKLKIQFDR
jgi:RNA polymerase sigma factor (sigma-70 family)